jgi:carboxyl-terminal processing protease
VEDTESQALIYGAIKGMIATLDPHSSFLTPDEYREFRIDTRGSFTGIGVEITLKDGILTVVSPIEGTPPFRPGWRPGTRSWRSTGNQPRT